MQICWFKFFVQFTSCVYFLCNFSTKPFFYIAFDSDCLKRSYGVHYTVKPVSKTTICNVRISKVFIIRKWNSLQGLFIQISRVILQRGKSYFLVSVVFRFRYSSSTINQRVIWYHSLIINCTWLRVFVKILLIKLEVIHIILVAQSVNWLRPYIEQNSLYIFKSGNKSLSIFLVSFGLLRTYLFLKSNFMLKSPRT